MQKRIPCNYRLEPNLVDRLNHITARTKLTSRAIVELCLERGLPEIEAGMALFGGKPSEAPAADKKEWVGRDSNPGPTA